MVLHGSSYTRFLVRLRNVAPEAWLSKSGEAFDAIAAPYIDILWQSSWADP